MRRLARATLPRFFAEAAQEHAETVAVQGVVERDFCVAGRRIRLRFAGGALADTLLPSLRPRLVHAASTPPDATVALWDAGTVANGALTVPWRDFEVNAGGLICGPSDEEVVAVHAGVGAVTVVDRSAGVVLHRVPDGGALPWWELAAPLRTPLFWSLTGPARGLVHGGAVGDSRRGGVLLAGAGGSGKTTVALAGLVAGFEYVADDYLLLETGSWPTAWNIYATAKLDDGHLARFPTLAPLAKRSMTAAPDEKAVLNIPSEVPGALTECLEIRAVIAPRIRGGQTSVSRLSSSRALLALAPSTAFQMPYDGGDVVRSLAALVRDVPCFALEVGDRPEELAKAVNYVLDEAAAPEPALPGWQHR